MSTATMQSTSGQLLPNINITDTVPTHNQIMAARQRMMNPTSAGPRTGLQKIPVSMSQSEAIQEHNLHYTPPTCYELEPVYFRKIGGGDERLGYILGWNNKHFTIYVMKSNNLPETVQSVSYYDPANTGKDAALNDPKAPHNTNGVFRRTAIGQMLDKLDKALPLLEDLEGLMPALKKKAGVQHP